MKFKYRLSLLFLSLVFSVTAFSQDQNFYIFLSFGQSNMEGHARFEPQDTIVNKRFKVLQSVDCPAVKREKGNWYPAKPPLCRCKTGLTPTDYFGRTLIEHLPDSISVGVVNVSVGGCKIELFDKDNYQTYVASAPDWLKNMVKEYDGNPYGRLVDMAKLAQQEGVIKGILMHHGESNTGDQGWPLKVKKTYDNLIHDLNLARTIPLLVGELVSKDEGGACASMNEIIARLPSEIPNAHIISSEGCDAIADHLHFSAEGYRKLGQRYGEKMMTLLER
ncbi:MAG TPA: sialate O-acetylesterase [Ohtaekwangia sp.]|nr:sialate O-acetylesterase [Ohtaekwangia sp.]